MRYALGLKYLAVFIDPVQPSKRRCYYQNTRSGLRLLGYGLIVPTMSPSSLPSPRRLATLRRCPKVVSLRGPSPVVSIR